MSSRGEGKKVIHGSQGARSDFLEVRFVMVIEQEDTEYSRPKRKPSAPQDCPEQRQVGGNAQGAYGASKDGS